jgi:hypothetical protein|nr:MAG TPA: protein of unknown function (DUF4969) [Caudoviricetes sp.]
MKRLLCVVLCILLAVAVVGCGEKASDEAKQLAQQAIDITNEYLSGNISSSDAWEKVSEIENELQDKYFPNSMPTSLDHSPNEELMYSVGRLENELLLSDNIENIKQALEEVDSLVK